MGRSEPLFLRTLQLLEGVGDSDDATQLELEVRMVLIHVQRLAPAAAIAAYRGALARARTGGPIDGRSPKVQRLVARCLDRMSVELQRSGDDAFLPTIEEAWRLREAVVAAAPGIDAWIELSLSLVTLAQECERRGDEAGRARWVARLDDAIAAAGRQTDAMSMEDRDRLVSLLLTRANSLHTEPTRVIELFEQVERVQRQSFERRPSRVSEVLNWVDGAWQLVGAYERAGRLPNAFAKAEEALRIVRAAEQIWAHDFGVMRYAMASRRDLAQMAVRHAQATIGVDALLDEAVAIAPRAEAAQSRRRTTMEECGRAFTARCRRRLLAGPSESALADATEAIRYFALAAERTEVDRSRHPDYYAPRLLQVEALLRLDRDDEAIGKLQGLAPLPDDVLVQVPTLGTRAGDARFAAILGKPPAVR